MGNAKVSQIAVAVVRHEGRVLIGQRPAAAVLAGYWEFPGGKIFPEESPAQAAARECREETGLEIRVGDPLCVINHEYEHGQVCLHFFACEPIHPAKSPTAPFRWVPIADLRNFCFPPANQQAIGVLLADRETFQGAPASNQAHPEQSSQQPKVRALPRRQRSLP